MLQDVHYIWAGEPSRPPFLGHDTIGPDLTSEKYPDHTLYFWCLKSQMRHYQRHFSTKHIKVKCIETYAKRHDSEFFDFIEQLKKSAMEQAEQNNKAREYTTLKAAFQFFLQIEYAGYFLDTNVIPNPTVDNRPLPKLARFSFPLCEEVGYESEIDPWLMYSPHHERKAEPRFNEYFILAREEIHDRSSIECINRALLGSAFVEAAAYSLGSHRPTTLASSNISGLSYQVGAFQKRYYNTHKKHPLKQHLFYDLVTGSPSLDELTYLLSLSSFDPSKKEDVILADKQYVTTVLHTALSLGRFQEVETLLPYAKNLAVRAKTRRIGSEQSLFKAAKDPACLLVLLNHVLTHQFDNNPLLFKSTLLCVLKIMDQNHIDMHQPTIDGLTPDSFARDLVFTCFESKSPSFRNALNQVLMTGPVTEESLPKYVSYLTPIISTLGKRSSGNYRMLEWVGLSSPQLLTESWITTQLKSCLVETPTLATRVIA